MDFKQTFFGCLFIGTGIGVNLELVIALEVSGAIDCKCGKFEVEAFIEVIEESQHDFLVRGFELVHIKAMGFRPSSEDVWSWGFGRG